jgi:TfoX/Sxy family transcriptional regulator of competence genes
MAYDEKLADRTREIIARTHTNIEEKKMFGGLCFMVNDKMCVGVEKERLMVRLDPMVYDDVIEKEGVRPMDFTGKIMKGYVFVDIDALQTKKKLEYWIGLALEFNQKAKAAKKKPAKKIARSTPKREELAAHYNFDYSKAKPNRFAKDKAAKKKGKGNNI